MTSAIKTLPLPLNLAPRPISPLSVYAGAPVCYHVTRTPQHCQSCGGMTFSEQVNLEVIGPRFRQFRTIARFDYNLPIHLHVEPLLHIPACLSCAEHLSLAHLPPPPSTPRPLPSDPAVKSKWRTLRSQPTSPSSKTPPTIFDL